MSRFALLLAAAAAAIGLHAQQWSDTYMGDWEGKLSLSDGKESKVAVYMIPHGDGRYEAKIVSAFNRRVPTRFHLRGRFAGDRFKGVDAMPFEPSRVIRTTEDGVVVAASLWSGALRQSRLTGRVAGKEKGSFDFTRITRLSPTLGKKPPLGAIVLFDGTSLDAWRPRDENARDVKWKLVDGNAMEVKGGGIVSKEQFRDHRLHLEFRTPYMPHARGQGRGNSGVYPVGRYEVQVLDSYGLEGADNECGGIYQIARPRVNMCAPPLQWQTYDITFRAARYNRAGNKTANARITVVHNGVSIHDNLELPKVTGGAVNDNENAPGGLMLQDHGNPVRYRNIWVEPLG